MIRIKTRYRTGPFETIRTFSKYASVDFCLLGLEQHTLYALNSLENNRQFHPIVKIYVHTNREHVARLSCRRLLRRVIRFFDPSRVDKVSSHDIPARDESVCEAIFRIVSTTALYAYT